MKTHDAKSLTMGPPAAFYDEQWLNLKGAVDSSLVIALSASVNRELYEWDCALSEAPGGVRPGFNFDVRADHLVTGTSLLESWRNPIVESIAQDTNLLMRVASILEVPVEHVFCHPNKVLRAVPPHTSAIAAPPAGTHIDFIELQGSSNQVTLWIPLAPVDKSSGLLPMYKQRDRFGLIPQLSLTSDNLSGWEISDCCIGSPVYENLDLGDAICFSTFTVHGKSQNYTDSFRTSLEIRYQPIEDPIAEPSLAPYASSSREEHYCDWPSSFKWYWNDRHPPSVPFDSTWERWRDVESLRVDIPFSRRRRALEIASEFSPVVQIREAASRALAYWSGVDA